MSIVIESQIYNVVSLPDTEKRAESSAIPAEVCSPQYRLIKARIPYPENKSRRVFRDEQQEHH